MIRPRNVPQPDAVRRRVTISGIVQGVGFRPCVHRLARKHGLSGTVSNFAGGVTIEVEGPVPSLDGFLTELCAEPPPIAVIDDVQVAPMAATGQEGFVIVPSARGQGGPVFVSPDVAICADCSREIADATDRRNNHPFINCTNCGPRFTIIRGVPYDRPMTSMGRFPMCPRCAEEYECIDDRRYHAQPVACPVCGPKVEFWDLGGDTAPGGPRRVVASGADAIHRSRELLASGSIVGVKGLGGFHLACDAANGSAVTALRERKGREEKPFAMMVRDLATAGRIAHLVADAVALLQSPVAPIVLAPKLATAQVASTVAPDSADFGIMLPYTPLHLLLFDDAPYDALVMTSGNITDEPLCTSNEEALERLVGLADALLVHDRDIVTACDDSVVRTSDRGPVIMRRSRGYVPFPVKVGRVGRTTLAAGAQLKNTFCVATGENAFISHHMGDLDSARGLEFFGWSVEHMNSILQTSPEATACDLHPDYLSTRFARELAAARGVPSVAVQHHHAHIVSCMAENHASGPVIGLACDGTGLGDDGTLWGCEVLLADAGEYRRLGHLSYVPLAGGDAAVRNPWRSAAGYLHHFGMKDELKKLCGWVADVVAEDEFALLSAMLQGDINCPHASSSGRLFDAASSLLGLRVTRSYEGQAAIALEAAAGPTVDAYPYEICNVEGMLVMDPRLILAGLIEDRCKGVEAEEIAGRFHNSVIAMLVDCAGRAAAEHGLSQVAMSGGTFQNRILLSGVCAGLEGRGLTPLHHRQVPPNDAGISLGQAVVADTRLSAGME